MTVPYSWKVELKAGTTWVDVSEDVFLANDITIRGGINGAGLLDRMADIGQMSFTLNNSALNTAGTAGYYSPDGTARWSSFDLGMKAKFSLTYGTATKEKFTGKIVDISPDFGNFRRRAVMVTCADYMNEIATHKVSLVDVQANKRPNECLQAIIADLPNAPTATDYATDADIYQYGLQDLTDEKSSAMTAAQHIAMSSLGYIFMKDGDTLAYETRSTRLLKSSGFTLNGAMTDMKVNRSAQDIINSVKVIIPSVKVDTSATALYTLQKEINIPAGGTVTFTARYLDPNGFSQRVSMVPDSEKTLVADTDYKMSSVAGNLGNDMNASLTLNITWGGNAAEVQAINAAANSGYLNHLVLSGKGIYLYYPLEFNESDSVSAAIHGDYSTSYNAYYNDNQNFGKALAKEIIRRLKDPFSKIQPVEFIANDTATKMLQAVNGQIGDKITITESITGINADWLINGYELSITGGSVLKVKYYLEPVWATGLFMLDVSQLNGSDVLYF